MIVAAILQGLLEPFPVSSTMFLNEFNLELDLIDLPILLVIIFIFHKYIGKYFLHMCISFLPILIFGGIIKILHIKLSYCGDIIYFLLTVLLILPTNEKKSEITYLNAFILGIVQCFAVIPGISRLGILLIASNLMKINSQTAFIYAWIISIPTFAAKSSYEILFKKENIEIFSLCLTGIIFYVMMRFVRKIHYKIFIYVSFFIRILFIFYRYFNKFIF